MKTHQCISEFTRSIRTLVHLAMASVALLLIPQAQAVPLLHDSFFIGPTPANGEYTAGEITGQNPTLSPYNSAWLGATGKATVTTGGVNGAGLTPSTGGRISLNGLNGGNTGSESRIYCNLNGSVLQLYATNTALYFSYRFEYSGLQGGASTDTSLYFGPRNINSSTPISIFGFGGGSENDLTIPSTVAPTPFATGVVANMSTGGGETRPFGFFSKRMDGYVDDFRIATTWGDAISVIPEPSTYALLALGCGAFAYHPVPARKTQKELIGYVHRRISVDLQTPLRGEADFFLVRCHLNSHPVVKSL
jgi:hypothetical protein